MGHRKISVLVGSSEAPHAATIRTILDRRLKDAGVTVKVAGSLDDLLLEAILRRFDLAVSRETVQVLIVKVK
jgi:hypothetical protein